MSDMREDVARAIKEADDAEWRAMFPDDPITPYNEIEKDTKSYALIHRQADAAIAVVFDGLIAEVLDPDGRFVGVLGSLNAEDIADLLRAKKAEVLGHE